MARPLQSLLCLDENGRRDGQRKGIELEPTALPMLPMLPLSATTANDLASLQNPVLAAENASGQPAGLFASLLSQLDAAAPGAAPVTPQTVAVFSPAPVMPAEILPPAGNFLPPATQPGLIDTESLPRSDETITDVIDQAIPLPVSGLLQPPQNKPLADTTTANARPGITVMNPPKPAEPAPVSTDLLTASRPAPVQLPGPGRTQAHNAPAAEPAVAVDPRPEPVMTVTRKMPVELTPPSANPQPAPTIATDSSTVPVMPGPTPLQPAGPAATSQHSFTLNHPIADARWGDSLGQRVVWLTGNGIGRAEIRLNPPELGPLHVRITVANDEAKVAFTVQHGTTRELVEAALPRLREMFSAQGIELTDASVSQHSPDDPRHAGDTADSSDRRSYADAQVSAGSSDAETLAGSAVIREGLIDTYA